MKIRCWYQLENLDGQFHLLTRIFPDLFAMGKWRVSMIRGSKYKGRIFIIQRVQMMGGKKDER